MTRTTIQLTLLLLVSACSPGKPPLRVAEICLVNQKGAVRMIEELKEIAKEEEMEFVDASKKTERGLEIVEYEDRGRSAESPTIHIAVQRDDGMGVTVGNMGLPGYQVALGFSEGSNRSEAILFADKVSNRLGQYWPVKNVPDGSGVLPNPACR